MKLPINQIICGDCLEVMKDWPDNCVDLVLTDPPYGIGLKHNNLSRGRGYRTYDPNCRAIDWPDVEGDNKLFSPEPFLQFKNIIFWGANHFASRLPDSHFWFAWDRKCGRGADNDSTDVELAWVKGLPYKTVRIFRYMWVGFQRDGEVGEKHLHPTQKPIDLALWCLSWFPNSQIILDPYCGSGTFCIAAKMLGKRYIGIDISEEYCNISRKRLKGVRPNIFEKPKKKKERESFGLK